MSDSDNELLPSNVYTFQNESTIISAKGPNINRKNVTNLSFRNNALTSTMQVPRNFEMPRYEPSFDRRSLYYRRETSPVSMYSDMRGRNFHHSFYPGVISSQRSMYNGRSGSPMSIRSIDSNASVSAADIALAFKNIKFNKYDVRVIKEAYNKFMKRRVRKRIEKRRNMRLFLKGYRSKSGYDSGELGSDSSISSDDCRSTTSAMFKDNVSSCRSTRTDIIGFRRSIRDNNMYKDCTDNFKQNVFKNMLPMSSTNSNERQNQVQCQQTLTQRDRFKSGFLLPSQRFNKSIASVPIPERDKVSTKQLLLDPKMHVSSKPANHKNMYQEFDSDQEEIFPEVTVTEKTNDEPLYKLTEQGKRGLELEDNNDCSERKRTKLSSPKQNKNENKLGTTTVTSILKENNINKVKADKETENFEFIKPQFPVRKSGHGKMKEKLISKSAAPLTNSIHIIPVQNNVLNEVPVQPQKDTAIPAAKNKIVEKPVELPVVEQNSSEMSMRPSFIKRKLFTQKMDVTEKKNLSTDTINVNSPQNNVYSAIQREKNKARKLVTNQSCLNRDIIQDDSNLLDLIHKIVPADRMNLTNATNKTSLGSKNNADDNKLDDDDKWDVTSIISTCNNDDVSDTYTDEEIFKVDDSKGKILNSKSKKNKSKCENSKKITECRIVIDKLPINVNTKGLLTEVVKPVTLKSQNDLNSKSVYNCVKSFWDTDLESDMESPAPNRWIPNQTATTDKSIPVNKKPQENNVSVNKITVSKSLRNKLSSPPVMDKSKKFNINRNLTIRSFLSLRPKEKNENNKINMEKDLQEDIDSVDKVLKETKTNKNGMVEQKVPLTEKQQRKKKCCKPDSETSLNKHTNTQNKIVINKQIATEEKKEQLKAKEYPKNKSNKQCDEKSEVKTKKIESPNNKTENEKSNLNITSKKGKNKAPSELQGKSEKNNVKPQNKKGDNTSVTVRTTRTPKKIVCCQDTENPVMDKNAKKNDSNSKNKKVVSPKSNEKNLCNNKESTYYSKKTKAVKKKLDDSLVKRKICECETLKTDRTLRSRKIDLSSSINTSTELTTITFRSLRTRQIDLSSSINSSLDTNMTIVKKSSRKKIK